MSLVNPAPSERRWTRSGEVLRCLRRRPKFAGPPWSAIFVGPSGVGKTRLAAALAERFFGSESALIQIDCSEFDQEHTLSRLVGAPPGYVGYQRGGQLCNALRRMPEGIILLDEIDKGHPAFFRSLLIPLLGEAAVHDMSSGERLDVSQFVVVLTANLRVRGESAIAPRSADDANSGPYRRSAECAVASWLPKEVAGRIDDVVVFDLLGVDALAAMWDREIRRLEERVATSGLALRVAVGSDVFDLCLSLSKAELGEQGARALRRFFGQHIEGPCLRLLSGSLAGSLEFRVWTVGGAGLRYELNPL